MGITVNHRVLCYGLAMFLIALRKSRPELMKGTYEPLSAQGDLLLSRRKLHPKFWDVCLNVWILRSRCLARHRGHQLVALLA